MPRPGFGRFVFGPHFARKLLKLRRFVFPSVSVADTEHVGMLSDWLFCTALQACFKTRRCMPIPWLVFFKRRTISLLAWRGKRYAPHYLVLLPQSVGLMREWAQTACG
jgi:hypothetical protein